MKTKTLVEIQKTLGYIPHPEGLYDNPGGLAPIAMLFGVGLYDIACTDIGVVEGGEFTSALGDEAVEAEVFAIWTFDDVEAVEVEEEVEDVDFEQQQHQQLQFTMEI